MKKAATLWLILGLFTLLVTGIIGDLIFDPQKMAFSFRILSSYAAALIMLVVASVCWICRNCRN